MRTTNATRRVVVSSAPALAGLVAAACGADGREAGPTEALPKTAAGPMELRVATNTSMENMPGWERCAEGYQQKYPTRKVKLEHGTGGAYTEQMVAQQAAGDPPPNFYTSTPGIHNFGPKGVFSDLMPLVKADRTITLKDIPDRALKGYTWQGKLHGMPVMADTRYLHYNVSLFKQAGCSSPTRSTRTSRSTSCTTRPAITRSCRRCSPPARRRTCST